MKTYEERRAALDREHAAKIAALGLEEQIRIGLPEFMHVYEPTIYTHSLYDRVASVEIKYNRFRLSSEKTPDPSWQTLRDVAAGFTFADAAFYRDGSAGVRSLDDARAELAKAEKRNPETDAHYSPIAPFWISVEPSHYSQSLTFHSLITLPGVAGLVELRIGFGLHSDVARRIGQAIVRRDARTAHDYEHQTVIENTFKLNETIRILGNAKAVQIRYGSGGHTDPGQHLIYWDACNGEPAEMTIATLIAKLESVGEL